MKKRIFWLTLLAVLYSPLVSAVSVTISDGIYNQTIKTRMEKSIECILNEVNAAQADHRALNFYVMGVKIYGNALGEFTICLHR